MKRWLEILLHVLFWTFSLWMLNMTFAFESLEILESNGERVETLTRDYRLFPVIFIVLLGKMIVVYGNAFLVMPPALKNRNPGRLVLHTFLLFLAAAIIETGAAIAWVSADGGIQLEDYTRLWKLNAVFFLCFYGVSVAYVLAGNWWKNEQLRQQLVREKLNAELDFLKSQVNPHFLFNTLNNLYALAERYKHSDLSSGIAELSNLMRYMLYDAREKEVSLKKEIDHLKSLISMHQLRYDEEDNLAISLSINGELNDKMIAPLLLVPFVENAFKHGVDIRKRSFIKIDLVVNGTHLDFTIANSDHSQPTRPEHNHSGIGLENVKRRLELIYPEQHRLAIEKENGIYTVKLNIQLQAHAKSYPELRSEKGEYPPSSSPFKTPAS